MSYLLYDALSSLTYGAAFPVLRTLRAREGREWDERLGHLEMAVPSDGRVWIHAASVGELSGVRPLVEKIRGCENPPEIIVSTLTRTGQSLARELDGVAASFYLPLDASRVVRRGMEAAAADVLILMETEIWPNLLREAGRRGMRTAIVNGRISNASFRYYRLIRGFLGDVLENVEFFGVQSELDAERFAVLGALPDRIRVLGSTKYDGDRVRRDDALKSTLRTALGPRSDLALWVAGCVRPGEEGRVLDAHRTLDGRRPLTLVLAPRHLDQVQRLEAALRERGLRWVRWTTMLQGAPESEPPQVILLDTIGDLAGFYGVAAAAFVGASLVPLGGHNPLEPASYGIPVLFGKHMDNYRLPADRLLAERGGVEVEDASDIVLALDSWLSDPRLHNESGASADRVVEDFRGAAEHYATALAAAGIFDPRERPSGPVTPPHTTRGPHRPLPRVLRNLVSRVHQGASKGNRRAYACGLRRRERLGIPVVSVGNLSLGGTGKTPLVALLARRFSERGIRVGVLSRGYGRSRGENKPLVVSDGGGPIVAWEEAGDEPHWLATIVPDVAVLVGRDRVASGRFAEEQLGCRLLILDDGFQHARLERSLDIVTIDDGSWTSRGTYTGNHWLREGLDALARAQIVVLRRRFGSRRFGGREAGLRSTLERRFPDLLVVESCVRPVGLSEMTSGRDVPLSLLDGNTVSVVSGLASPENFERSLVELGAKIDVSLRFPDHHSFGAEDIEEMMGRSPGLTRPVVTTEKDAVRLSRFADRLGEWLILRVETEIVSGADAFHTRIDSLVVGGSEGDSR